MKLARFHIADEPTRLGRVDGDTLTDISDVPGVGTSLRAILPSLPSLKEAILAASGTVHPLADVVLEAPVDDPQKYLGIGMNYAAHAAHAAEAAKAGILTPTSQFRFNKQVPASSGGTTRW